MALSDEELLEFDEKGLPNYDRAKARRDLEKHGNAFRYQLVAARQLERWAERDGVAAKSPTSDRTWLAGHERALRDVAAHLRQGDYLPGGGLHDDIVSG
jgi:predicted metal-dependent phosphoesterase TrpH